LPMSLLSLPPRLQLVEIGAGAGHWQRELTARGADVLAYENGEEIPLPQRVMVGDVKEGDHSMAAQHPERTLFLCYPPQSEMAFQSVRLVSRTLLPAYHVASPTHDCVRMESSSSHFACDRADLAACVRVRVRVLQYKGDRMVYIGEGRGGVNASPRFFSVLEVEWICERVEPLAPFAECFEKMYVMRRRVNQG
jgi:hypothetical protein